MIPLPWAAAAAVSAIAAWWARGKTGDPLVSAAQATAAAAELCARLELVGDVTATQLAVLAGDSIAPAVNWPPRPLAKREHKAAWAMLLNWAREVKRQAADKGVLVCDIVRPKTSLGGLLIQAATVKTTPGQIGGLSPGAPSNISDYPTPGSWSKPLDNPGAGLLQNVGFAYAVPSGGARLAASKAVNNHPWNRAHAKYRPTDQQNTFELNSYGPDGILSFDGSGTPVYFPPAVEALP